MAPPTTGAMKEVPRDNPVWFRMQFRTLAEICLLMPLIGLLACLIVALIFQFEHIQETACKVRLFRAFFFDLKSVNLVQWSNRTKSKLWDTWTNGKCQSVQ